jgi:hypothetical protein
MDTHNATSSPGSVDGLTPSTSRPSRRTVACGPDRARVNLSARQAEDRGIATHVIYGPPSVGSSSSAALQLSLESKLRARLDVNGSPEYRLTWKHWTIRPEARICALRASAPPTCGRDSTGWPSPVANDSRGSAYTYGNGKHENVCLKLLGAARMTGWPTPRANDSTGAKIPPGRQGGMALKTAAKLAGWGTPTASQPGGTPEAFLERKRQAKANGKTLGVSLTALALQVLTTKSGVLNPQLSRWLMGFPAVWGNCAPTATPSSRKSPPSS